MKKFLVRLIISGAILLFLSTRIDTSSLKEIFRRFSPIIYISAVILMFGYQILWALAWKITLRGKGYNIGLKDIYRAILISHFFGLFIPTTIGPDIMLTYSIGRAISEKQHAASSLLFIRSVNIFFNLLVSGTALLFLSKNFILKQLLFITWILVIAVILGFYTASHEKTMDLVNKIFKRDWAVIIFFKKILASFSEFGKDYATLIRLSILGILMAFARVCIDYTLALSLGMDIPYKWFLALIPCITIITTLPISIGGLGVREGSYMGIFTNIGIQPVSSMSISFLVFSAIAIVSIAGGVLYIIHGSHIKYENP